LLALGFTHGSPAPTGVTQHVMLPLPNAYLHIGALVVPQSIPIHREEFTGDEVHRGAFFPGHRRTQTVQRRKVLWQRFFSRIIVV
jgi:hypothetical protein